MDREGARGGAFGCGAGTAYGTLERMRALRGEGERDDAGVARAADDGGAGAARPGASYPISRAFASSGIAFAGAAMEAGMAGECGLVVVRRSDRALRLARAGMAGDEHRRSKIIVAD